MRHRSTWMTPLVALTVAGFIACGGGDAGNSGEMEAGGQASEEAGQMQETSGAVDSVRVTLAPKNESGVKGTATIRQPADTVHVTVSLTGLSSGSSYPAHIHEGTCQGGGGVAAGLTPVKPADGSGSSETRIPAASLSMDASYFVQAHLPDGTPAACGDLPSSGGGSGSSTDTATAGG